jgi:hypothetical protein
LWIVQAVLAPFAASPLVIFVVEEFKVALKEFDASQRWTCTIS